MNMKVNITNTSVFSQIKNYNILCNLAFNSLKYKI